MVGVVSGKFLSGFRANSMFFTVGGKHRKIQINQVPFSKFSAKKLFLPGLGSRRGFLDGKKAKIRRQTQSSSLCGTPLFQ
jgi:hypothetical protein